MTRAKKVEYALIIAACALAIFLVATSLAYAQTPQSPARAGLIPCGVGVTQGGFISSRCQACDLVALAQNVVNFLIYIAAFVAALMFAWAGWLFMSARGSEENISRARSIFGDILFGFVWMLAAWLIVDTLMKYLLTGQFNLTEFGGWKTIKCVDQTLPAALRLSGENPPRFEGRLDFGSSVNVTGYKDIDAILRSGSPLSHDAALELLTGEGIRVTSSSGQAGVREDCSGTEGQLGCTSLSGLNSDVIAQIIKFKQECGCTLTVTAGTEQSIHATASGPGQHISGDKVDIAFSSQLDRYILNNAERFVPSPAYSTSGYQRYCDTKMGAVWTRESNHWDLERGGARISGNACDPFRKKS